MTNQNPLPVSEPPNFASNLKCWRLLNKLVFSEDMLCPSCQTALQENYANRYLWCKQCRKKYRATAYKCSWCYGMKISSRQLFTLVWCWRHKVEPDTARLLAGVSRTTIRRWYRRFESCVSGCAKQHDVEQLLFGPEKI